jgi:hypothetical protein
MTNEPLQKNVHFSSESDNWATPTEYFERLSKLFNFTLDPCASAENAKCERFFDSSIDGLSQSWKTEGAVYVNPPYGKERPLLPLKQLKRAEVLIGLLSESQSLWQDPIPLDQSVYVLGEKVESHECFFLFNSQKWQDFLQNHPSVSTAGDPLPRDPFVELSGLLSRNCANSKQVSQELYRRFVSHLDLDIDSVDVAALTRLTSGTGFTLMDAYASFTVNNSGRPCDVANLVLHRSALSLIADHVKWCSTVRIPGIAAWVKKAYEESRDGTPVVMLLPARTDTAWWNDYCTKGLVKFVRGRLKFGDGPTGAPFPSAIVIFANLDASAGSREEDLLTLAA